MPEKHYKATHARHPMTLWAASKPENYAYMAEMALAMCAEYTRRYGKVMKPETNLRYLQRLGFPPAKEETLRGGKRTREAEAETAPARVSKAATQKAKTQLFATHQVPEGCSPVPLCFDAAFVVFDDNDGEPLLVESYRKYYRSKPHTMRVAAKWGTDRCPVSAPAWLFTPQQQQEE